MRLYILPIYKNSLHQNNQEIRGWKFWKSILNNEYFFSVMQDVNCYFYNWLSKIHNNNDNRAIRALVRELVKPIPVSGIEQELDGSWAVWSSLHYSQGTYNFRRISSPWVSTFIQETLSSLHILNVTKVWVHSAHL